MWIFFLLIVAFSFVVGILKTGSIQGAAFIVAWIAPFVLVAGYFASRKSRPPSTTERVLARGWLLFRRTVCYVGAACVGMVGFMMLLFAIAKHDGGAALASGSFFLLCGLFVRWGIYGAGEARTFADDRPVHEERRRRYGWK